MDSSPILAAIAVSAVLASCSDAAGSSPGPGPDAAPAVEAAIAVTRFGLGARPGELDRIGRDPRGWLKAQITPAGADQPGGELDSSAEAVAAFYRVRESRAAQRRVTAAELGAMDGAAEAAPAQPAEDPRAARRARRAERMAERPPPANPGAIGAVLRADLPQGRLRLESTARIVLAMSTEASFRERWALFWGNHFTVAATSQITRFLAGPFEREAVRPHVFGRFETMLLTAARHPGMLSYLDQTQSVGPNSPQGARAGRGLNENLAREILELHTLGSGSGYAQADVTELARALTGWSVARPNEPAAGEFLFRARAHEPGSRTLLGRSYAEGGEAQARAVLVDLAADPRTAKRLCRKLAAHFVADEPPPALTARLERAWTDSRGDLAVVARALVDAPEAWAPTAVKVKTPYEFVVSAQRALGPGSVGDDRLAVVLAELGHQPLSAPSPEGWSDEAAAWATPSGLVKRLTYAEQLGAASRSTLEPAALARQVLGARLRPQTAQAVTRAESRSEALTLLLMSPEFQRR